MQLRVDDDIQLELIEDRHAEALFQVIDDNREYLTQWLPFPPLTQSVSNVMAFILHSREGYQAGLRMVFVILYRERISGVISFNKIQQELSKAEIGYWLAESEQGQGIISCCCRRLITYAFEDLSLDKVEIRAASKNLPSRGVCERLGFELEGVISQSQNLHGKIIDHAVYGRRREDAAS